MFTLAQIGALFRDGIFRANMFIFAFGPVKSGFDQAAAQELQDAADASEKLIKTGWNSACDCPCYPGLLTVELRP